MKFVFFFTALLVLLHNSAASAVSSNNIFTNSVARGSTCSTCREVGDEFLERILMLRNSINTNNFERSLDQFMKLIRRGGAADFTNGKFKNDCCVTIFGEQFSNTVPSLIAYGFIGRVVLPGHFLLAFKAFQENNENATIRDFIAELGSDFEGNFFRTCRFRRVFPYPCLTGPGFNRLRIVLDKFIDNRFDLNSENAERLGTFLGNTVGAYESDLKELETQLTKEFRTFEEFELPRCCNESF